MLILAKSKQGYEFFYNARTAHKVSAHSAKTIMEQLNKIKYKLQNNEVWYIHEIDKYDVAHDFAEIQSFTIYNGNIRERGRVQW